MFVSLNLVQQQKNKICSFIFIEHFFQIFLIDSFIHSFIWIKSYWRWWSLFQTINMQFLLKCFSHVSLFVTMRLSSGNYMMIIMMMMYNLKFCFIIIIRCGEILYILLYNDNDEKRSIDYCKMIFCCGKIL